VAVATFVFYVFSAVLVFASLMVISARNSVHSVLFLILCFFNAAGLFLLLGAEYLAMTLVIVYVGAVAVLFLFVVMMLDVNFDELREGFLRYLPIGLTVAGIFFAELMMACIASIKSPVTTKVVAMAGGLTNTQAIGRVLYTQYAYLFQVAGLILLVAMVGAIVLTLRYRPGVRRQKISSQLGRKRGRSVILVKLKPGEGAP